MTLPVNTPTEFDVARVEVKKTLPAKDGQKPATILKLGLIAPDGAKDWAEFFCRDGTTPPSEGGKETLILTQPDNPAWALKAARPRAGGGGPRRRDPAETRAIQRQHSQEMAIRAVDIRYRLLLAATDKAPVGNPDESLRQHIKEWTDWFEADIANGKAS